MSKSKIFLGAICALLVFTGCENIEGPTVPESKLTPGKVQQNISEGMSSAEVVKALGTPNIITRNKSGKTSWVYDKVSTYHSKTDGGLDLVRMNANDFVIAGGVLAGTAAVLKTTGKSNFLISAATLGLATWLGSGNDYEYKTEQKTLTIVLDFDANERLQNFSYMYSSF